MQSFVNKSKKFETNRNVDDGWLGGKAKVVSIEKACVLIAHKVKNSPCNLVTTYVCLECINCQASTYK